MAYAKIATIVNLEHGVDDDCFFLNINGFFDSESEGEINLIIRVKIHLHSQSPFDITTKVTSFKTMLRELREDSKKQLSDLKGHKIKCYFERGCGNGYNDDLLWVEYYANNS